LEATGAAQRDLRKIGGTRHADLCVCRNQLRFCLPRMSGRRSSRDDGSPGGCYYREFRPHPRGTLIADLVDELATVPTIALDLEDWESLCRIDQHIRVQGVCVTVLDQREATKVKSATKKELTVVASMIS
jgi:hypothetical protein